MKHDDVALLESLVTELIDALTPVRGAIRNVEVALEILRRRKAERGDGSDMDLSDLIDESRFNVRWKGAECHLGSTVVFRLFCRLARPANHYVSVALLLDEVWGDEQTEDATVRSTVRHLRRKLKDAGMGELAEAIRVKRGYYGLMLKSLAQ